MSRRVDPEVLIGFLAEAKSYLPKILQGIDAFGARPNRGETLEEAHRHAHTIKGAASMVGLNALCSMANRLEESLEQLMTAHEIPPIDATTTLLRRIVEKIELYLEGKASGSLREKPLLEEVNRAYHELRSLPTEERLAIGCDDEPPLATSGQSGVDWFARRLEDVRGWIKEATAGAPGDMTSVRQPLGALQTEAFRLGWRTVADAIQRLGVLTEVWECLAADGPEAAEDVAGFCYNALDYLARAVKENVTDHDTSWIIHESTEHWSEYLALLEPGSHETAEDPDILSFEQVDREESTPAIDPGDLLRMLTGQPLPVPVTRPTLPIPSPAPRIAPAARHAPQHAAPDDALAEEVISSELRDVFALEAEDHLRDLSSLLPALEQQPENKDLLQDIRRSAHTLKGSAALVGFRSISQLARRMEDLLDLLHEEERTVSPAIIHLLFASTSTLEDLANGKADSASLRELHARYDLLLGARPEEELAVAAERPAHGREPSEFSLRLAQIEATAHPVHTSRPVQTAESLAPEATGSPQRRRNLFVRFPINRLDELVKLLGELVITRTFLEQRMTDLVRQVGELEHSSDRLRRVSARLETQFEASALGSSGPSTAKTPGKGKGNGNGNGHSVSLTTQTHGFDDLEFDRYTEFHLLTRSLAETTSDIQTVAGELGSLIGEFDGYLNRQARLSSEVEDKLMRSRMVPLATLASRLHRAVRNVANEQGKLVELVLEGESTELDKSVLEEMADPLLHLVRNSIDHGIERPEVREAVGKEARGVIRLRAGYVGSQVELQISDDGAGLDPQLLRSIAVDRGFVTSTDAANMSDADLFSLVYLPGFSTAQQISEVSGHGVGLDIVKTNVHKLKGSIALGSRVGEGTTFTILLPMTMAIIRTILVKTHQESFAIPLCAVKQILRLDPEQMEWIGQDRALSIGGQVYPLFTLGEVLSLKRPADDSVTRKPVLIVEVGARQFAMIVDHLVGGREIVVKNLGNHLRHVPNVMGATLMGDGSVVLILDPVELTRNSVGSNSSKRLSPPAPVASIRDSWSILIVDDSPSVRRVLSNLVKNAGWRPTTARDGLEALENVHHSASTPDLILLDVEMPRMDGYELLARLKAHDAYKEIPVVMVTSRAGDKHRRKALELGGAGYVVKPYQDEALLNIIRHLVRESRSKQAILS